MSRESWGDLVHRGARTRVARPHGARRGGTRVALLRRGGGPSNGGLVNDTRGPEAQGPSPEGASSQRLLAALLLGIALAGAVALLSVECALDPEYTRDYASRSLPPPPEQRILPAEGPDEFTFPCSDCHEFEPTDRTVRELVDDHEYIELAHGDLWCLHCHDADDRDRLHLTDGAKVEFQSSWRLCVQCHGTKEASWRAGVHGKRTGHWWGDREVWTCVSCHRPHAPGFRPIEPEPPPTPPQQITLRSATGGEEATHE